MVNCSDIVNQWIYLLIHNAPQNMSVLRRFPPFRTLRSGVNQYCRRAFTVRTALCRRAQRCTRATRLDSFAIRSRPKPNAITSGSCKIKQPAAEKLIRRRCDPVRRGAGNARIQSARGAIQLACKRPDSCDSSGTNRHLQRIGTATLPER
jgi:hypothetical protein